MNDQSSFYVTCKHCGRENHPQQVRCWVCGYPFTDFVPADVDQQSPQTQNRVAKTVAAGAVSGIGAFFITLGGILGGILIGIFLAIALVVALFTACIQILSGGSATLFF